MISPPELKLRQDIETTKSSSRAARSPTLKTAHGSLGLMVCTCFLSLRPIVYSPSRIVFAQNGGIIGRGILLDWYSWAARNGISLSPFRTNAIEISHLKAIVKETGLTIRPGDILFIRSGFVAEYKKLSTAEREKFPDRQPGGLLGLEATQDSLRWLWENRFAAIAGDASGFERGPATGPYNHPDVSIHQWALAGWGMPIGSSLTLKSSVKHATRGEMVFLSLQCPTKGVLNNDTLNGIPHDV